MKYFVTSRVILKRSKAIWTLQSHKNICLHKKKKYEYTTRSQADSYLFITSFAKDSNASANSREFDR